MEEGNWQQSNTYECVTHKNAKICAERKPTQAEPVATFGPKYVSECTSSDGLWWSVMVCPDRCQLPRGTSGFRYRAAPPPHAGPSATCTHQPCWMSELSVRCRARTPKKNDGGTSLLNKGKVFKGKENKHQNKKKQIKKAELSNRSSDSLFQKRDLHHFRQS